MARSLSIVLCFAIATALEIEVEPLPDLDGRGARVLISPDDLEVDLTWCEIKEGAPRCESVNSVTGEHNVTSLQSYTRYNFTAEAVGPNETETAFFTSDVGTPTTLFNVTVEEEGAFSISLSWTAMNSLKLKGPPTGYKIVYCNTTCGKEETDSPKVSLSSLKPRTLYNIRMWAFNVDSFGQRLENEEYATSLSATTAPDSQTSLIFVISGSVGVLVFIVGFIIYIRKSRKIRRKTYRFNIVKSYEESHNAPTTRSSV